jgi:hypothetical protein
MKSYEVYRFVERLKQSFLVSSDFVDAPGYKPFRAALDALREGRSVRGDSWGVNSAYDCERLVAAGVPAEQIIAIAALCFPNP